MTQQHTTVHETTTSGDAEHHETVVDDTKTGLPHGDEEAGGAVGGGVAGAVIGAVVGGPVGAIVGGAIGAVTGTTAGAIDQKAKEETVVVTREVHSS